jgi:hypothetical protein
MYNKVIKNKNYRAQKKSWGMAKNPRTYNTKNLENN